MALRESSECRLLSSSKTKKIEDELDRIAMAHQDEFGDSVDAFVNGSIVLWRMNGHARKRAYKFDDMDLVVPDTITLQQVEHRIHDLKRACNTLKGSFMAFRYLDTSDHVMVKTKCTLSKSVSPFIPIVNTVLLNHSMEENIRLCKIPATAAYKISDPTTILVPNREHIRAWNSQRLPHEEFKRLSKFEKETIRLKYAKRGLSVDANPAHDMPRQKRKANDRESKTKSTLINVLAKREWCAFVTAKTHYQTGAMYRNVHMGLGVAVAMSGMHTAWIYKPLTRLPIVVLSIVAGVAFAEYPNTRAIEHQRSGARYGNIEQDYAILASRLKAGSVDVNWAEAYAANLQARKSELDAESPNAPCFFANRIKHEFQYKKPIL